MSVTSKVDAGYGVRVDDRCWMYPNRTVTVRGEPDIAVDLDIEVRYDEDAGQALVTEVHVFRREDGAEVTSTALRDLRIAEWSRARAVLVSATIGDRTMASPTTMPKLIYDARRDASWDRDQDLWVSRLHTWAVIAGLNPTQEVAAALNVSARTATRRVARARSLGLLPPADG